DQHLQAGASFQELTDQLRAGEQVFEVVHQEQQALAPEEGDQLFERVAAGIESKTDSLPERRDDQVRREDRRELDQEYTPTRLLLVTQGFRASGQLARPAPPDLDGEPCLAHAAGPEQR